MTSPQPSERPGQAASLRYVDSLDERDRLFDELRAERLVAVDTEAASFHRYQDRIYLVQVSSRTRTAVLDPLALPDLAPLGEVLADPSVEVVFHDADYDLRLFEREYGFKARNIFDTRIAAQLLNEPGVGLAALLEKYLGIQLDKRFQRADWSRRPLSEPMLEYAAMDTRYLPELRDILREQLERKGRLAWAEEEFALLEKVQWSGEAEPSFLRLKGAKALPPRTLAVLRELQEWREQIAERLDRAPFRVMHNEALIEIAKAAPRDAAALRAVPGISAETVERRGGELLAAVRRGLAVPDDALPRVERPKRPPFDPDFEVRVERLKTVRDAAAIRLDLAPGVLCPKGTLEAIARAKPKTPDDLLGVPGIRRWQVSVMGEELLRAVNAGADVGGGTA